MADAFMDMLAVGGKSNSLGRAAEVVDAVLADESRLDELYGCLFADDAWLRMRAVDSLEKVCRVHPEWLLPYVDRLLGAVAANPQPSIQWHLAQMFGEINLSPSQRNQAVAIMKRNIATADADWIVASNTMETLAAYVADGTLAPAEIIPLLLVQRTHRSGAVVKRANRILERLTD